MGGEVSRFSANMIKLIWSSTQILQLLLKRPSPGRLVSISPPAPLPVTKSPFLLMTIQNQTRPAPYPQNQPPDALCMEMSKLTRDGTAEPVSRDQILRHERRQGNIHFSCSADHVQDWQPYPVDPYSCYNVIVVVFFTLTDRASTIPSNIRGCQSCTWSQRGAKVNRSHHGDNPLLRPTGIQIATKSYATLQAMAPTNIKTVHQTSFTPYREQPRSTLIVVAYPRPAFSATNRTNMFQPVLINNNGFSRPHIVQK